MEQFRNITVDYTDFIVGDHGTVMRNGHIVTPFLNNDGYMQVNCRHRTIGVHRLVAMAFVDGQSDERNEVNHIDFDRSNNDASNLEWVSHTENIRHSAQAGRKSHIVGSRNPNYGNHVLHDRYVNDKNLSCIKQGRPGAVNGKACKIDLYKDGQLLGTFDYIGACCVYLHEHYGLSSNPEVIRCGIRRSIRLNTTYRGFTFKKH